MSCICQTSIYMRKRQTMMQGSGERRSVKSVVMPASNVVGENERGSIDVNGEIKHSRNAGEV
jgi:hypothetical protein